MRWVVFSVACVVALNILYVGARLLFLIWMERRARREFAAEMRQVYNRGWWDAN
jgi:hypothetical protein